MASSAFVLAILVIAIGVGLSLGLYVLVRAEGATRHVVGRKDAERLARRDTDEED